MTPEIPTIEVFYSCPECGLKKVPVAVPIRTTENIKQWMDTVLLPHLGTDHALRSPNCRPKSLKDVMIPIKIGGPCGD